MMTQFTNKSKLKILNKLKLFCWIALFTEFILKILGVYYIDKGLNVEWLINLNEFVTKHKLLEELLNYISCMFITFLLALIVNRRKSFDNKNNIIIFILGTIFYLIKCLPVNIDIVSDIGITFVIPLIVSKENKWKIHLRTWVAFAIMIIFQLISMIIRINEITILNDNIIFNQIMLFDYYIMFILYYLYSIEKGK